MRKNFNFVFIALLTLSVELLMSDCSNDDNESKISSIDDIIPLDIQKKVSNYMPIYKGDTPPNIEGSYYFQPVLTYSTMADDVEDYGIKGAFIDEIITFTNQTGSNHISYLEQYLEDGEIIKDETMYSADSVYVFGSQNRFTVCAMVSFSKKDDDGTIASARGVVVISGNKTSLGIADLYYSGLILEKNDPKDILDVFDINQYRIGKDFDDLANNYIASKGITKCLFQNRCKKSLLSKHKCAVN